MHDQCRFHDGLGLPAAGLLMNVAGFEPRHAKRGVPVCMEAFLDALAHEPGAWQLERCLNLGAT